MSESTTSCVSKESELRRAEELAFTKLKEKEAMNQKEIKHAEESMLRQETSLTRELAGLEERLLPFAWKAFQCLFASPLFDPF